MLISLDIIDNNEDFGTYNYIHDLLKAVDPYHHPCLDVETQRITALTPLKRSIHS